MMGFSPIWVNLLLKVCF